MANPSFTFDVAAWLLRRTLTRLDHDKRANLSLLSSSFERDGGDAASERLKRTRFGNNLMVLEVKETACAQADEKQQKRKKKEKGGWGKEGRSVQGQRADVPSPVCRFVSRERCSALS